MSTVSNLIQWHGIIQRCFDWDNRHLYGFKIRGEFIDLEEGLDIEKPLSELGLSVKNKFKNEAANSHNTKS